MLFDSTIRRELSRSFGANLLVLFTIVLTMLLIRTLGLASKGSVNPQEIVLVLTYTVLAQLPTVLTIALFIAIVSTLSRMYADSEMAIWFTAGRGLASFLGPILRFAWPVLLAIALLVSFAWPWSNAQVELLRDRYEQRGDLERVTPGQFQESSGGRRVFFIDRNSSDDGKEGRNVFIASTDERGRESITSARSGRIEWRDGEQFLLLGHGQRLELPAPGQPDAMLRVSQFDSYGIRVGGGQGATGASTKLKAHPTRELIEDGSRAAMGELTWRAGMALTAFNFVLIAVAVSVTNPRAGRSGNLVFLLCSFVLYYNLVNLGAGWIASAKVGWLPYLAGLHGGVLLLTLAWLAKRHYNIRLWPRRRAAAVGASA